MEFFRDSLCTTYLFEKTLTYQVDIVSKRNHQSIAVIDSKLDRYPWNSFLNKLCVDRTFQGLNQILTAFNGMFACHIIVADKYGYYCIAYILEDQSFMFLNCKAHLFPERFDNKF